MSTQTAAPERRTILKPSEKTALLKKRVEAIKSTLPRNWLGIAEKHYPEFEKSKYRDSIKSVLRGKATDEDFTVILEQIAAGTLTLENAPL